MRKNIFIIIGILILLFGLGVYLWSKSVARQSVVINSFKECITFGGLVTESYPRQCRYGDKTFTEEVQSTTAKDDFIRISSPMPNQLVKSPLTITGVARGSWFFEASFPVMLTDWNGRIIGRGIAQTKSDWMTSDFISFEATLTFTSDKNAYSKNGTLILKKDNPSGLPANDDALEMPVVIGT
ncbi:MAG: Gmad2 immunoglobulin-like domain-containing protein [bacterium]|nr:Gmad2 immunoglobulin-like domain-containing protein [bacterium]